MKWVTQGIHSNFEILNVMTPAVVKIILPIISSILFLWFLLQCIVSLNYQSDLKQKCFLVHVFFTDFNTVIQTIIQQCRLYHSNTDYNTEIRTMIQ